MTYERFPLGEPPCAPTAPRILPRIFPRTVDGSELCYCGKRRGLHRYGDECCPNPRWSCGNGGGRGWNQAVEFCAAAIRAVSDGIQRQE